MQRVERARARLGLCGVMLLAGVLPSLQAGAAPLDIDLSKLGPPVNVTSSGGETIAGGPTNQEKFARFASEFGLAIAPLPSPPETLGQSGFEVSISEDIAYIHPNQKLSSTGQVATVWPTVEQAPNQLYLTSIHFRKGLPLSLEFDADLSYIGRSSMAAPSAGIKWAILEGMPWVPDISIGAFGGGLIGAQAMTLVVFGWDAMIGYRIPIWGSAALTFDIGYQELGVDATSMNVDFDPSGTPGPASDTVFTSLSYGNFFWPSIRFSRLVFGAEVKWNILVVGIDAAGAWGTNPIGDGMDSSSGFREDTVQLWKVGFRAGVRF